MKWLLSENRCMLRDVVEVKPLEEHKLFVRFEDGVQGVVDAAELVSFKRDQ